MPKGLILFIFMSWFSITCGLAILTGIRIRSFVSKHPELSLERVSQFFNNQPTNRSLFFSIFKLLSLGAFPATKDDQQKATVSFKFELVIPFTAGILAYIFAYVVYEPYFASTEVPDFVLALVTLSIILEYLLLRKLFVRFKLFCFSDFNVP